MKKLNFKNPLSLIIIIILTIGVSISFQSAFAIWQVPIDNPPNGNIAKPINESGIAQTKIGGFGVGKNFLVGSDVFFVDESNRKVGIGTTSPKSMLTINNNNLTNVNFSSDLDSYSFSSEVMQLLSSTPMIALIGQNKSSIQSGLKMVEVDEITGDWISSWAIWRHTTKPSSDPDLYFSYSDAVCGTEKWWHNEATKIVFTSDGKIGVGLGVESPRADLHIKGGGSIVLEDNDLSIDFTDSDFGDEDYRIFVDSDLMYFEHRTDVSDAWSSSIMTFNSSGGVGINGVSASNELEVVGNASKSVAGSWLANSDARIKTNIIDSEGLDLLNLLRPVKFQYTQEYRDNHQDIDDKFYYNFIAQEFAEVFPKSVKGSGEFLANKEEILQLDAYNASIISVKAIQELSVKIKELENRIKELEIK